MPHDSVDVPRDEDQTDPRRRSRRHFKLGGRRGTDNPEPSIAENTEAIAAALGSNKTQPVDRRRLLERLLALSLDPDGLDRETLKNIDELAWGIKKEDG